MSKIYQKAFCLVIAGHAFLFLFLFLTYKSSLDHLFIKLDKTLLNQDLMFVFMPVLQQEKSRVAVLATTSIPGQQTSQKATQKLVVAQPPKAVVGSPKKPEPAKKETPAKKEVVKAAPAKKNEIIAKKESLEKNPKVKKVESKKTDPVAEKPKIAEQVVKKEIAKVTEPIMQKTAVSVPIEQPLLGTPDNPMIVQATASEIESYRRAKIFHEALMQVWRPPKVLSKVSECIVTVQVGVKGDVEEVVVNKSSGVLMYDVSATAALYTMQMPELVWGKSLTLLFKV